MLQWCQKQGSIYVPVRLIRKLDRETKTRRKKKYFGYVYANLCKKSPPPSPGSDAYVLTLYTPTQNIGFFNHGMICP